MKFNKNNLYIIKMIFIKFYKKIHPLIFLK